MKGNLQDRFYACCIEYNIKIHILAFLPKENLNCDVFPGALTIYLAEYLNPFISML